MSITEALEYRIEAAGNPVWLPISPKEKSLLEGEYSYCKVCEVATGGRIYFRGVELRCVSEPQEIVHDPYIDRIHAGVEYLLGEIDKRDRKE